ncbi:MAG: phosphatase PAP2 family protein [Cytophagales bacterium]|nr:phosphatase PAP2 family protein [Armatimonadota bacterium]
MIVYIRHQLLSSSNPDPLLRPFPPARHHWLGWGLILAGLVVTALTPRFEPGFWKDLGAEISGKPYNAFLALGIVALLYLAYAARSRASFLRVTVVMLTETALYGLIKAVTWFGFHAFARPSGRDGGFPSGHTAAVCALAYLLTERWPKLAPLWYAAAAAVGWSRWSSGAHYPYQVVAGAILGLTVAVVLAHRFPEPVQPDATDAVSA